MNSTRLSAFCDKVLEMGWLLAVIVTPLFFNVYSSRVFEPDKLTTLRTIAVIMAAVWLTKFVDERIGGKWRYGISWRTPLVLPTLFIVAVYLISTVLSVTPRVSLLGSYQRLQGTFTMLSYIVVFLVILQGLRTRAQLDRLITVIILNSLPIAVYGIVQHNKADPLPWGGDVTQRVASNMGNAIFVAAYLIMVIPLTLARTVSTFRSILADEASGIADVLRAAAFIFIFFAQVITIYFSQSRGPMLGLLTGLGVWAVVGTLSLQRAARQQKPPTKPLATLLLDAGKAVAFLLLVVAGAIGTGAALYYTATGVTMLFAEVGARVGLYIAAATAGVTLVALWEAQRGHRVGWILAAAGGFLTVFLLVVYFARGQSSPALLVAAGGALLAGTAVWLLFIVNRWGWRWLWMSVLLVAIAGGVLFLAINPGGPLNTWASTQPTIRRYAGILTSEGGTAKVRSLIWEGALKMVLPHAPIQYPPTTQYREGRSDPFNVLRPLIGYGPESMYVSYNRFYPPLLGHYESRTASPDRSHNETMDSLATTGLLGFLAYVWMFGSVLYFSLKWLGFVSSQRRRVLLLALLGLGVAATLVVVLVTVGPKFLGLTVPVGMVAGLLAFLAFTGVAAYWEENPSAAANSHAILLTGILATVVAHLIEINFGIAIASTRTTFWALAGVLAVAGLGLISEPGPAESQQSGGEAGRREESTRRDGRAGKRSRRRRAAPPPLAVQSSWPSWLGDALAVGVVGGFILGTLAFDFITNADRLTHPLAILWRALTTLPAQGGRTSYGALLIFALTWLVSAVILIAEMAKRGAFAASKHDWVRAAGVCLATSALIGSGFALTIAGRQASFLDQPTTYEELLAISDRIASLVASYYGFIIFVLLAGGAGLLLGSGQLPRKLARSWSWAALSAFLVLAAAITIPGNLYPIQADIIFKQAEPYEQQGQWEVAVAQYQRAIELAPREDFYYLYLGRALLEYAMLVQDPARESVLQETERTLIRAREINPLNTDHSANLARMYRRWADLTADEARRRALLESSSENYTLATSLSPNNAILWNEWSLLYYYGLKDVTSFERTHQHSMELDPGFDQTWLICGDTSRDQGKIDEAAQCYRQALDINPKQAQVWRVLADTYIAQEDWVSAVSALSEVVELQPAATTADIWSIHQVLSQLYVQLGQPEQALLEAQIALQLAPENQQAVMQEWIAQIAAAEAPQQ